MRTGLFAAIALACALVTVSPALAATMRYPEEPGAAFDINLPDDWTHEVSKDGLTLRAPEGIVGLLIAVADDDGTSFDAQVADAVRRIGGSPPRNKTLKLISNHFGAEYDSDMANFKGVPMRLRLSAVAFPGRRIGVVAMMMAEGSDPGRAAEARAIYDGLMISGDAPSSLDSWR